MKYLYQILLILANIPHINFTKENIGHHFDLKSTLNRFFHYATFYQDIGIKISLFSLIFVIFFHKSEN